MESRRTPAPLAARHSAVVTQLEERERRGVVVALLYLFGLVATPVAAVALIIHTLGNLLGLPLIALMAMALTQRRGYRPVAAGARDPGGDGLPFDGFAPLHQLGPALGAMLERLASRVGAPMPSVVYLSPETFAAGWIPTFQWHGVSWSVEWHPVLILGVVPMRALGREELEAVLAHEFGHLSRPPGLCGVLFAIAQEAAEACIERAQTSGFQRLWNPTCWWTAVARGVLDRTVVAAGRLEELRADEVAVRAAGAEALAGALDRYVLNMVQLRALAAQHLHSPATLRELLNQYFEHGERYLPPPEHPDVQSRLRVVLGQRSASHPSNRARRFLASRVKDQGEALADPAGAGTLYLLPPGARAYLPGLVRTLVEARHTLARKPVASGSPWAVCQDHRQHLPSAEEDGWLPRWQVDSEEEQAPPRPRTRLADMLGLVPPG